MHEDQPLPAQLGSMVAAGTNLIAVTVIQQPGGLAGHTAAGWHTAAFTATDVTAITH